MAKYRIDSVQIEGFKAFTKSKTIPFGEKNIFLFGDNGSGKSSIIEAIRWCLFGGEKEETLRNTFYQGDCRVDLRLNGTDETLEIHRRLRSGLGKSDVGVLSSKGEEANITDLFPYMSKLGGEGIYVFTASQLQPTGRSRADISQFGSVIYAYLGLSDIREFLQILGDTLEEYQARKGQLDCDAGALKTDLETRWKEVEQQLEAIEASPPWEGTSLPTTESTHQKINGFLSHLSNQAGKPVHEGEPGWLLDISVKLIDEIKIKGVQPLTQQAQETGEKISQVGSLWTELQDVRSSLIKSSENTKALEEELAQLCKGRNPNEIEDELNQLEKDIEATALRASILQESEKLLEKEGGNNCPICGKEEPSLLESIRAGLEQEGLERQTLIQKRDSAQQLHYTIINLLGRLHEAKGVVSCLSQEVDKRKGNLCQSFGFSEHQDLGAQIESYSREKEKIL